MPDGGLGNSLCVSLFPHIFKDVRYSKKQISMFMLLNKYVYATKREMHI